MKPDPSSYNPYYKDYIDLIHSDHLIEVLKTTQEDTQLLLSTIPSEKEDYRYAEGKWTVKEVIQHCIDCERVFQFRAMTFARGDTTALPGFSDDDYVAQSMVEKRTLHSLANEYQTVRNATISLFETFDNTILNRTGMANGGKLSVSACGFIICGHEIHHKNVLKERYHLA